MLRRPFVIHFERIMKIPHKWQLRASKNGQTALLLYFRTEHYVNGVCILAHNDEYNCDQK